MTRKLPDISDHHLARYLGSKGRGGDTMVAHINPQESSLLKMLGGSGTRNPKTGLLEFKYGADTKEGGAHGTGSGAGTGGGGAGNSGQARSGGPMGGTGAAFGGMDSHGHISQAGADRAGAEVAKIAGALNIAQQGYGQTLLDRFFGSLFGSPDLTTQAGVVNTLASGMPAPGFGSLVNLGTAAGQTNQDLATAIGMGLVSGQNLSTSQGTLSKYGNDLYGGINSGQASTARLAHDINNGSFSGGDLSGYARDGAGGPGNRLDAARHANAARAQQANTGGGLVAVLNPVTATTVNPNFPAGLLLYLAQSMGMIPGYSASTRFGAGSVAPISYMRSPA